MSVFANSATNNQYILLEKNEKNENEKWNESVGNKKSLQL